MERRMCSWFKRFTLKSDKSYPKVDSIDTYVSKMDV